MSAHVPALPLEADPLIAEAKRRARRRRLIAATIVVVLGAAAGVTFALRSSGGPVGLCASPPPGWKKRTITDLPMAPPTIVLTNFRFGDDRYLDGLFDYKVHWPRDGVMIAVSSANATPAISRNFRVRSSDFGGFEGAKFPFVEVAVRPHGRVFDAYVELRTVTPAMVAAANRALAGVTTCSA